MKKSILIFGAINCSIYILLFLLIRTLGLLHLSGLRMLNYVTLCLVSFYQVHRWGVQNRGRIRFLQGFTLTFFTGTLSFFLFAAFIFFWSLSDPYFSSLYFDNSDSRLRMVPFILVFFEGSATCIIIGLIMMMYIDRFRNRES